MTPHNTQLRLILLLVTASLLTVLLIFGFYQIFSMNSDTARLLAITETAEKEEELVKTINDLRENASSDIAKFENLGFSSETLVPTIESIEAASRALGIETEIISVERKDEEGAALKTVKISLKSSGSWRGNFSFLKALENLPLPIIIESHRLSKTEQSWRSQIVLSLKFLD